MKQPKLKHVKFVRSRGKVYAYFNTGKKRDGQPIYQRLPDPASVGFYDSYAAMLGARTKRQTVGYTVADLARDYEYSPKFSGHAKATQELYSKTLRRIALHLGKFPVSALERHHVQKVLDAEMAGPGAHNVFVAVLGLIYKWARERGKTDVEPTKDISRLKIAEHEPWPLEVLEAALASDNDLTRLAVHLLYFTGQRVGDVVAMRWSNVRDGVLTIVQGKTGKDIVMPLPADLRDELARTTKRGLTILADELGRPYSTEQIRRELQAFTAAMGHKTVPHGLRKNAVNTLLESGSNTGEVSSITGQSLKLVEHYAKRMNRREMAEAAVLKFENKRRSGKRDGKHGR